MQSGSIYIFKMADDFQINDPVLVVRKNNLQLEGVIAFLGPVSFAQGDDWVGVRLTGSSVGLGRNDGSVHGQQYFETTLGQLKDNFGTVLRQL